MMKNMQSRVDAPIQRGTVITGKWNHRQYKVIRKIGAGMIGTVYMCRHKNTLVALKISEQSMSLTTEVNVLKALGKVQDHRLGPFLFDVDDWESVNGHTYSFYVMEFVNGVSLEMFISQHGDSYLGIILLEMLTQLEELHQHGWVFGDLKNENILVTTSPLAVRFIDVGGTTKTGRSVKEYSEFYDRAYWQLGTRRAEPSYDLFALAMVVLAIYYPKHFKRTDNIKEDIFKKIAAIPALRIYENMLQKAISGNYLSAKQMREDLVYSCIRAQTNKVSTTNISEGYVIQAGIISFLSLLFYGTAQLLFP